MSTSIQKQLGYTPAVDGNYFMTMNEFMSAYVGLSVNYVHNDWYHSYVDEQNFPNVTLRTYNFTLT